MSINEKSSNSVASALQDMTAQELRQFISIAEGLWRERLDDAKQKLVEEFKEKANELGLSVGEILSPFKSAQQISKIKDKRPAKYRGPNGEEWSGRGRMPKWLVAQELEGKKREEFAL